VELHVFVDMQGSQLFIDILGLGIIVVF